MDDRQIPGRPAYHNRIGFRVFEMPPVTPRIDMMIGGPAMERGTLDGPRPYLQPHRLTVLLSTDPATDGRSLVFRSRASTVPEECRRCGELLSLEVGFYLDPDPAGDGSTCWVCEPPAPPPRPRRYWWQRWRR